VIGIPARPALLHSNLFPRTALYLGMMSLTMARRVTQSGFNLVV
jgi:hypothetical protein